MTSSTSTSGAEAPAVKPDYLNTFEPCRVHLAAVCDKIARHAGFLGDLAQAVGIRAVFRADDEDQIGDAGKVAHRALAVLRGVADVARLRPDDVGEAPLQRLDQRAGVVDAEASSA